MTQTRTMPGQSGRPPRNRAAAAWGILAVAGMGVLLPGWTARQPSATPTDGPDWVQVRRIIESRCLSCHGGEHRKSGLSFADRATFRAGGDRGAAINEEQPSASRLLAAIGYANPDLAMPPDGQLDEGEQSILRGWVEAGAPWPDDQTGRLADPAKHPRHEGGVSGLDESWWAYEPLATPAVPASDDGTHPIDAFINDRLARADLAPGPRADAGELLRRATFDLTGLPPTPEERAAFLTDWDADTESAWSALIDRLLASPTYGEHWARHWLDQVRYAETNGYERDGGKPNIWRYRDWVIRSLNADMPYDRFVIEQLAGDELVAAGEAPESAYLATGFYRLGVWDDEPADRDQARADEIADIVDTTGQVFLGMTVGCARCHDHKADPISQKDYFSLTAFFSNITGYGSGTGQHLRGGMTRDVADEPTPGQLLASERDRRIAEAEAALTRIIDRARSVSATIEEKSLIADARSGGAEWRYHIGAPPDGWMQQGFDDSGWATGRGGFGDQGVTESRVATAWSDEWIVIRARFGLSEIPAGLVLSLHHDDDADVFINGQPVARAHGYAIRYGERQLDDEALRALVIGSNVIAIACRNPAGPGYLDAGLRIGVLDDRSSWITRLRAGHRQGLNEDESAEADRLLAELDRLASAPVTEAYPALVVAEFGADAPAQFVHLRGSVHAPGDEVQPTIPAVLAHAGGVRLDAAVSGADTTGRRLALARWLVGDGRFLTARVAANRLWQFHFGRGLCRSSGDFGRLGERPTHPELLDFLAQELISRGWSLKEMHRFIMTSEVYRRSSVASARALERDPRNDLYARADARRMTAEQFRDSVLKAAGLLHDARYGPSVYPPLPEEVLATASRPEHAWGVSSEEDARRRSVYVFSKRSLRPPLFESLDQPDPDRSCPVRFPTNVPTQALITLNGAFTNDAAAAFAERIERETDSIEAAVRRGVLLALGREADEDEVARHMAFLDRLGSEHRLSERERLRVFCLMLVNLNEFLWVD